jgi:hypothetical protein
MTEPREVTIDGVRYVPAREAVAGLDDLREALLDVWWGEGYRGSGDPEDGMYVIVSDTDTSGTPFKEFMDELAAKLTRAGD